MDEKLVSREFMVASKIKSRRNKFLLIAAIVLLVGTAAFLSIRYAPSYASASGDLTYKVEQITSGKISKTVSGSGTLVAESEESFTASADGTVTKVNFAAGDEVSEDDVIAIIEDEDGGEEEIIASFDGIVIKLPVSKNDEVLEGAEIAEVMDKDGFNVQIAVEETDISSINKGDAVQFDLDASSSGHEGSITSISYVGETSNGATTFPVVAHLDYEKGLYPGMTATTKIVVEESDDGLIIPSAAVNVSGDDRFVYLAPEGSSVGESIDEGSIVASHLEKVKVSLGMSDDSYVAIASDELNEGDLVLVPNETSSAEGRGRDEAFGGPGGMSGEEFGAGAPDMGSGQMSQGGPDGDAPRGGGEPPSAPNQSNSAGR